MPGVFKTLTAGDITKYRTMLYEAIPITGSIISGTYADENIKNATNGTHQSVYDYPYLSSSANHIFDITVGYSNNSSLSGASNSQNDKKIAIYNSLAQQLMGYDTNGNILEFDRDGDILSGGTKLREVYILNFSRLLCKDEIKKASFTMSVCTGGTAASPTWAERKTISDYGATTAYRTNSPAGEYGILYTGSSATANTGVGLIFYQAGVVVISGSIMSLATGGFGGPIAQIEVADAILTGSEITASADGLRNRIYDIDFNNTTELNSKVCFCRLNHNEFNYSSNPTYVSASKIRVKNVGADEPVSYITGIGLYSSDGALLAVSKLSEVIKKSPQNDQTLRVRLDY